MTMPDNQTYSKQFFRFYYILLCTQTFDHHKKNLAGKIKIYALALQTDFSQDKSKLAKVEQLNLPALREDLDWLK